MAPLTFFLPSLDGGGAERVLLTIAGEAARRGHEVDLVVGHPHGPYAAQVPRNVRVVDLRAPRILSAVKPFASYLRAARPRAVLSTLEHANIAAVWSRRAARSDSRLLLRVANTVGEEARASTHLRARAMPLLIRRFYPWADGVVANSQGSADAAARAMGVPAERIRVIPNPAITPRLAEGAKREPDHEWLRDKTTPIVLGMGRLAPQKDFATLLRAFASTATRHDARLVILGEGEERAELERLATTLGIASRVSLPGFAADPYPLLANADLFVLSSRFEGSPNALIEAMACGARVVSTDCPSGPREILADGEHGHLVPVGDTDGLGAAIARALDGDAPRAPARALARYHLDSVAEQYLDALLGGTR